MPQHCSVTVLFISLVLLKHMEIQSTGTVLCNRFWLTSPLRKHSLTTYSLAGISACIFCTFYVTAVVKSIQSFLWHPSQLIWRHKFIRAQCSSNKKVSLWPSSIYCIITFLTRHEFFNSLWKVVNRALIKTTFSRKVSYVMSEGKMWVILSSC